MPDSPSDMDDDALHKVRYSSTLEVDSLFTNTTSSILYKALRARLNPSLTLRLRMPTTTFAADLTCRCHPAPLTWPPASKPSLLYHSYVPAARMTKCLLNGCNTDPRHRLPPRHPLLCIMGQLPPPTGGRHLRPCTTTQLDMWEVLQPR